MGYFRLLWLVKGWGGAAVLPTSSLVCEYVSVQVQCVRPVMSYLVIFCPLAHPVCRLAPGRRSREGGLSNPVCPGQRAASVQVLSLYVCELVPLLYPTTPARLSIVARPSSPGQINLHLPSTPATPSVSTTKVGPPASSLPLRPAPSTPSRPSLQAHGGALERGARRHARLTAKR